MFWLAWRSQDRAEVVVAAVGPDRPLRARRLVPRATKYPEDAEVPACRAVVGRTNLPVRRRYALIAAADFWRDRDGAGALASVPAGDEQATTAEVRDLASAGQAVSAPEDGRGLSAADGKIPVRPSDPVQEAGSAKAENPDMASAEVGQCDLDGARNSASVEDVDSAQAPDGAGASD